MELGELLDGVRLNVLLLEHKQVQTPAPPHGKDLDSYPRTQCAFQPSVRLTDQPMDGQTGPAATAERRGTGQLARACAVCESSATRYS